MTFLRCPEDVLKTSVSAGLLLMKIKVLQTMGLESAFRIAPNWPKTKKMRMTSQFFNFEVVAFFLSRSVSGPGFMSISLLVLELR